MQVDSTRFSRTERNGRITLGLCLYCGQQGHLLRTCPIRPPRPVVSTILSEVETANLTLFPVTLHTSDRSLSVSALVDSGSSGNFISQDCLKQLQLPHHRHHQVYAVTAIQGKPLRRGKVRHSSPFITLQVGLFHQEEIKFLVLEESTISIILGHPWLRLHRPEFRWDPCDITRSNQMCHIQCLSKLPHPHTVPALVASTQIESPEPTFTPEIPAEYMAFQDVFSKQAATHLPPHRPWDCAIDLLPGAQLPKGRVYPLSITEHQTMEDYIAEALYQGFIRPSTSPAASSFFFVGKKDGGLRPCIDYRQLNSQIIQQPYPLPLVPAALKELRGAQVFTKLDLRSVYNLVRIREGDEWKTAFVTPTGHCEYQVMPYGLSISPSVFQTFMNEVFREFLHRFVVVYIDDILIYSRNLAEHRQHIQQVLLKLRQHHLYLKLEKCEFHKPSVQFLGYNISAEGVLMDQGKVDAIQKWPQPNSIKELQRFLGFTNFYCRFIKGYSSITAPLTSLLRDPELPFMVEVDASTTGVGAVLSQAVSEPAILHPCSFYLRKLSPAEQKYNVGNRELLAINWPWRSGATANRPQTHPPPNLIVSPIIWNQDQDIQQATLQEPALLECPEGSKRTLSLLQTRYWWPSMRRDIIRYVQSCSVCAMSNSPHMLPTGKLVPLPIPERPWSHLGVDYVTDLPSSEGNTCVLVIVDHFSKACKFVPPKGLSTAAEHLFHQVFRHFGIPEEIVSDRGPQFISHVWKAFFKLLGVIVNLSSGYHPQTNDQTEKKIQELGRYLQAYCSEDQYSWSRFLPWAEYAQISLRQDTTGLTPFQCVLGYQPPLFPWMEQPSNVPAVDHWFRESERVEQYARTSTSPTPDVGAPPITNPVISSGCPPATFVYSYHAAS
ncbi:Transposon Tf2-11 polyprotein [Labeo rohita]|uniref:Gypsy retrotransposon integrase-like protein 1 n=1 Tax=Labeo rohita TaxID=84645 RepID=A0ABQ8LSW4_LABRO|nr:Transposon Tf2-11 polyprotein [Labeo rohita]